MFTLLRQIIRAQLSGDSGQCIHVIYGETDCARCQLERRIKKHEPLLQRVLEEDRKKLNLTKL